MKKKTFGVCGRNRIAALSMATMMLLGGLNLQAQKSNAASGNANVAVATAGALGNTTPETVRSEWKKLKGDITLYMANDLGRNGYYDQKPIAELMGGMGEVLGPKCVLAVGDIHHFNGVASVNDPLWMTNFEQVYSHPELMLDWFPVLGNHEYRGNTQAVLDYGKVRRRWMMPARY